MQRIETVKNTIREKYPVQFVNLAEQIFKGVKEQGQIGAPVEQVRNALDGWLKDDEIKYVTRLIRALSKMVSPFVNVELRQYRRQKFFVFSKGELFDELWKELPAEPEKEPREIKCICGACGKGFKYFGGEGSCQIRYRESGEKVDSLVLCPECEKKPVIEFDDGKLYFKRGAFKEFQLALRAKNPKKRISLSNNNIKKINIDAVITF